MDATFTNEYTPAHFAMNPETEDLLPDGTYLREGMVVLIEGNIVSGNPERLAKMTEDDPGYSYEKARCDESNRWAKVTHLKLRSMYDSNDQLVTFIAVYADGTKRKRTYNESYAWFVKLDSIPEEESAPVVNPQETIVEYSILFPEHDAPLYQGGGEEGFESAKRIFDSWKDLEGPPSILTRAATPWVKIEQL